MEDDGSVRELLREALERAGHKVMEAADGEQGVALYASRPADLVIADMVMPRKSGWEAILELRRTYGDVKAIGISAGDEMGPFGYLMLAKKFGAKSLLMKPIKKRELLETVDAVLAGVTSSSRSSGAVSRARTERKSVLVLDADARHLWDLCEGLATAGHTVTDVQKVERALDIAKDRAFDAAALDISTMGRHDEELFARLRRSWTDTTVVAMADFGAVVARKLAVKRGAHHFIAKPVDVDELLEVMFPSRAFTGRFHGFDILEYLQFILQNGKKTIVELKAGPGGFCRLYCEKGDIVHASSGTSSGEDAFFEAVRLQGGTLTTLPWEEPMRRTISKPGEFMLIEAARRRDELQPRPSFS
jgi:DNA-binding response OmpR family regulator